MLHTNISVNAQGRLAFAGADVVALAEKYGTPLYLMDEERIRENCRMFLSAMRESFGEDAMPSYASKALCCKEIYRLISSEGLDSDVVSYGELHTALAAGFPAEALLFHGSNKTDEEIARGVDSRVGFFIADNIEELERINSCAAAASVRQRVLLRLSPGIDPHTFAAVATGRVDSKFGTAIATGQAMELAKLALSLKSIDLSGFHCHIGSQIFESAPFIDAADIMLRFAADVRDETGFTARILDLGGGFGVRYTEKDPVMDIPRCIAAVAERMRAVCAELSFPMPRVFMEPGRSIVADAGLTVYTVGAVKTIPGFKSYVSVDGGMGDNPRHALYHSEYTVLNAGRAGEKPDMVCDIAGRCCESGDVIEEGAAIVRPERGDRLAVLVTGAYNFSMASNYNRLPRPPIVMLSGGSDRIAVRRETCDDLVERDV